MTRGQKLATWFVVFVFAWAAGTVGGLLIADRAGWLK